MDLPVSPDAASIGITSVRHILVNKETPIIYITVDPTNCNLEQVEQGTHQQNIWTVYKCKKNDTTGRTDPGTSSPPEDRCASSPDGIEAQAVAMAKDKV